MTDIRPQTANHQEEALARLENIYNTFVLSTLSVYIYVSKLYRLDMDALTLNSIHVNVKNIKRILQDEHDNPIILNELSKSHLRTFFTDAFDIFNVYLVLSERKEEITNRQWYHFARIIRDSLNAYTNYSFRFSEEDAPHLPVSFFNRTLSANMAGQPIPFEIMDFDVTGSLFNSYKIFITSKGEYNPEPISTTSTN